MANLDFKAFLVRNGIKQKEIAEMLNITQENVNSKLNGRSDFTLKQVRFLCNKLQISADDYFI